MPLRDTLHRGEQALIGAVLRGVACRHPSEAGELLTIADRIDPEHCEDDMGRKGQNIRYMLDRLQAADGEVERLRTENQNVNNRLAEVLATGTGDAEDQQAEAELEAVVAAAEAGGPASEDSTVPAAEGGTPNLIDQV